MVPQISDVVTASPNCNLSSPAQQCLTSENRGVSLTFFPEMASKASCRQVLQVFAYILTNFETQKRAKGYALSKG